MSASGCYHYREGKEMESLLGWIEPAFLEEMVAIKHGMEGVGGRVTELLEDLSCSGERGFGTSDSSKRDRLCHMGLLKTLI